MPPDPPRRAVSWATYADCAAEGIWHEVRCQGCLRRKQVSAKSMVERGLGHLDVIETKHRLKCEACGHRGAVVSVHGYWIGPAVLCPPDWAETVEARIPKRD